MATPDPLGLVYGILWPKIMSEIEALSDEQDINPPRSIEFLNRAANPNIKARIECICGVSTHNKGAHARHLLSARHQRHLMGIGDKDLDYLAAKLAARRATCACGRSLRSKNGLRVHKKLNCKLRQEVLNVR